MIELKKIPGQKKWKKRQTLPATTGDKKTIELTNHKVFL